MVIGPRRSKAYCSAIRALPRTVAVVFNVGSP